MTLDLRKLIRAAAVLNLATLLWAADAGSFTYRGEISDSQCGLNVHSVTRSHQEMLKSKSMGGNSASCTIYCIRYLGGDLVLTSRKHVYHLDDQELATKFVGQKVTVSGRLDSKTDTIHVTRIDVDQ